MRMAGGHTGATGPSNNARAIRLLKCENYLPKIHRAITAMFNHKKTVIAKTATKADTSTISIQ